MSVECEINLIPVPEQQFREIDYKVMKLAFDIHNDRGNLWDECAYKDELHKRALEEGFSVQKEVKITLSHENFIKHYYIDLIIEGCIYELKATSGIMNEHIAQTLNYLFLTDTNHGKIINFGERSLSWKFVSTSLTESARKAFTISTAASTPDSEILCSTLKSLLSDWGAYLETPLYRTAICSLLNLDESEPLTPLSKHAALHLSAVTQSDRFYQQHLTKYLIHTPFQNVHWINFDKANIQIKTIQNNHSA